MQARIFVTGAAGFIAKALIPSLVQDGALVFALIHNTTPDFGDLNESVIYVHSIQEVHHQLQKEGSLHLDAVIHLAGVGIGDRPWTENRKAVLTSSRWDLITRLHDSMKDLGITFSHVLGASAIGYYGDTGDNAVEETAAKGQGFAADLCEGIEQRLASVSQQDKVKWHALRIGVVLGSRGGVLARLALPAKLGLGSVLGDGTNWLSWIDRHDLVRGIVYLLQQQEIPSGPVNMVSPNPVTWQFFSNSLASVFGRRAYLKVPAFLLSVLGEMKGLFLDSVKVTPGVLISSGFEFESPQLQTSLGRIYTDVKQPQEIE